MAGVITKEMFDAVRVEGSIASSGRIKESLHAAEVAKNVERLKGKKLTAKDRKLIAEHKKLQAAVPGSAAAVQAQAEIKKKKLKAQQLEANKSRQNAAKKARDEKSGKGHKRSGGGKKTDIGGRPPPSFTPEQNLSEDGFAYIAARRRGDMAAMTEPPEIPTDWLARVLFVREVEPGEQSVYYKSERPYYCIWARRIKPVGNPLGPSNTESPSPDLAIFDPCKIDPNPSRGIKVSAKEIFMHPRYYPRDISLRMPQPGDLINIHISHNTDIKLSKQEGEYIGFVVNRPLPDALTTFTAGAHQAKRELLKTFPNKPEREVDKKGCASGEVSDEELKQLSYLTPKFKRRFTKFIPRLPPNTKRFIKALDEELAKGKINATINSIIRDDRTQWRLMYNNWRNFTVSPDIARVRGKSSKNATTQADKDRYIKKLYGFWGNADLDELVKSFKSIQKKGFIKSVPEQKAATKLTSKHPSSHQTGMAIDISFKGKPRAIWQAVKKAAKRTCSHILIEKDHWHINTKPGQTFGWSSKTFGRKFAWLESPKGPPKEKTA